MAFQQLDPRSRFKKRCQVRVVFPEFGTDVLTTVINSPGKFKCKSRTAAESMTISPGDKPFFRMIRLGEICEFPAVFTILLGESSGKEGLDNPVVFAVRRSPIYPHQDFLGARSSLRLPLLSELRLPVSKLSFFSCPAPSASSGISPASSVPMMVSFCPGLRWMVTGRGLKPGSIFLITCWNN